MKKNNTLIKVIVTLILLILAGAIVFFCFRLGMGTMEKAEELIATPYRHDGSTEKAKSFFEDGMLSTCKQIYKYSRDDIPVTIYYAYTIKITAVSLR